MKVGPAIRRLMPDPMERSAAKIYRSVFVDLSKVAKHFADALPANANVLDIGGGDGELLNHLLTLRQDLNVTMVDIAPSVGRFVERQHLARVSFCPGTPIQEHLASITKPYDAAIISDVMHHIPGALRVDFLASVSAALRPGGMMLVKDIEPGHIISKLSLYADKYISGDRGVVLVSRRNLCELATQSLPKHNVREVELYAENKPNYIMNFTLEP